MLNGCVLCASMICSQANFFVATLFWKNKSVLYTNIHNTGNDAISCVDDDSTETAVRMWMDIGYCSSVFAIAKYSSVGTIQHQHTIFSNRMQ